MTWSKKLLALGAGFAVATGATVFGAPSTQADTVVVECLGDDDTLAGNLLGVPTPSQEILNFLGSVQDPPSPPPVSLVNPAEMSFEPTTLTPGTNTVEFSGGIALPADLLETAAGFGITSIDIVNMTFEIAPGDGVTGASLIGEVDDFSIPVPEGLPEGTENGPFIGTFEVTADVGETVSFELVSAHLGFQLTIGTDAVAAGLECLPDGSGTIGTALVLPPVDDRGPDTPSITEETDFETAVTTDVLDHVTDGPAAATDPSSLRITTPPTDGTAVVSGGEITYTPDDGFEGTDQMIYEVCTEEFVVDQAINEVQEVENDAVDGTYTLTYDGQTTAAIAFDADAATVQAALEALSSIGAGNVSVTASATGVAVEFTGALAGQDLDEMTADDTALDDGEVTISSTDGAAEVTDIACNSGVLTIEVGEAALPPAPPAPPQPGDPDFTG